VETALWPETFRSEQVIGEGTDDEKLSRRGRAGGDEMTGWTTPSDWV
jgi:hypothetical protein